MKEGRAEGLETEYTDWRVKFESEGGVKGREEGRQAGRKEGGKRER